MQTFLFALFFPAFADCPELSANIATNYQFWKQKLEEEENAGGVTPGGMSTLAKVDSVDSRSDSDTLTLHDNQSVASEQDKDLWWYKIQVVRFVCCNWFGCKIWETTTGQVVKFVIVQLFVLYNLWWYNRPSCKIVRGFSTTYTEIFKSIKIEFDILCQGTSLKIALCKRSISFKSRRQIHKELPKRKILLDFEMRDLFVEPGSV